MKLIVTGGAGFIGSAVVRYVIENTQDEVVCLDKLTYAGNLMSLTSVADDPGYVFEKVDICDAAEVARVFSQHKPDADHLVMDARRDVRVGHPQDGPMVSRQ